MLLATCGLPLMPSILLNYIFYPLKLGIADDGANLGGLGQSPSALAAIGKGSLDVVAPRDGDGLAVCIGDLAAEGALDRLAELELNSLDGTEAAVEVASLALAVVGKGGLATELDGLVLEDDADFLVVTARLNLLGSGGLDCVDNRSRGGSDSGGGQDGEEDVGELHFDWWVGWVLLVGDVKGLKLELDVLSDCSDDEADDADDGEWKCFNSRETKNLYTFRLTMLEAQ
jgi:hypothetical protein